MRSEAEEAGELHSVRELLERLGIIQETMTMYPSAGELPKARRVLSENAEIDANLAAIFKTR